MINITIDNPDIEQLLLQTYGTNYNRLVQECSQFIQSAKIKDDIAISLQQLELDEGIKFKEAFLVKLNKNMPIKNNRIEILTFYRQNQP